MKAGIFVERTARPAQRASTFNGTYNFNANSSNPYDTNFGFANAMLGTLNSYTESTAHPFAEGRFNQTEFFVQDNWRLNRKFTLDYGLRMVYMGPTYVSDQEVAYFESQPAGIRRRRRSCTSRSARTAPRRVRAPCASRATR